MLSLIFARNAGNVIAAMIPIMVREISISAIVNASALGLKGLKVKKLNGVIKSVLIKSHDNRLVCFSRPQAFLPIYETGLTAGLNFQTSRLLDF